jgi:hypothetical protein
MRNILFITAALLIFSCSQGVRVENQFQDEVVLLANQLNNESSLKTIGHLSGADYQSTISASSVFSSGVSKIVREEDDIFVVYPEEQKILSIADSNFSEIKTYDLSTLGEPIDLVFPNTSNGYFTVKGSNSIHILDRISREIASINVPLNYQPTMLANIDNRIYVAKENENSIGIIATNLKSEIGTIDLPGKAIQLGFRKNTEELFVLCEMDSLKYRAVFIDATINEKMNELDLPEVPRLETQPRVMNLFVSPSNYDFCWLGTDSGVYRIDLRTRNQAVFINLRASVYNIYSNSIDADNNLFYLGENIGEKFIETVNPVSFSRESKVIVSDNINYIFPIF